MPNDFWPSFLSLLATATVVMGSPGPSTVSMVAVAAAFGWRRSMGYLAGLVLGTISVLLAVATGVVSILLSMPRLGPVLLTVSALYMLYLAYRIATAPPLSRRDDVAPPSFVGAYLLAIANPKAYFALGSVFAGATLARAPLLDAALKVAILAVFVLIVHVVWLVAGAAFARALQDPVRSRIANVIFAATLLAAAAMVFI